MKFNYDVIYIGSGHAAWHGAMLHNQTGKKVAIIEREKIAGTCTNYGCNPKILLEGPFEDLESIRNYGDIFKETPQVDWSKLMNYKQEVIEPMHGSLEETFKDSGIDIIKGDGHFIDKNTVQVNGENYSGKYIVIATGQRSNRLDIEGKSHMHSSKDFLDLKEMPKRITFLGGGYISIEFASMAIKMGSEVNIISHSDKILKPFHQPYVKKLEEKLKSEGVKFHYNIDVNKVEKTSEGVTLSDEQGFEIQTDYIVDATGRIPNIENLGLDKVGVKYGKKGVKVDKYMKTSIDNIYASGDVVNKKIPKLTPTATFESNYIALNILGSDAKKRKLPTKALSVVPIKYPAIPHVIYTLPRIAQVGVSIEKAEEKKKYKVKTIKFGKQLEFQYKHEKDAELKIVLDKSNNLKGAVIYGSASDDLINILTFIIEKKISGKELNKMIFAFPSASAGILQLLGAYMMGIDL